MMNLKIFNILVLSYVILTDSVVSSVKYKHISECRFYSLNTNTLGDDNVTVICAEHPGEVFYDKEFQCSNIDVAVDTRWVGKINFENCRLSAIETSFFDNFVFLHTLIISDAELETLQMKTFLQLKHLETLDASHNRLQIIPPMIFINAIALQYVDFSNNSINNVSPLGFTGAISLQTLDLSENFITDFGQQSFKDQTNFQVLNISHNRIYSLDLRNMSARNLLSLDVSNNILTTLVEHTFDELTELKTLNLSCNPIGNLKIETFAYLSKLEHLSIRKANISIIHLGTFSHQQHLHSLNLADNLLKHMDFNLFLPGIISLQSIDLSGNQITDFTDFHNSLFPSLNDFDIKNNRLNCSYLQRFMKSVNNWHMINRLVDPKSIDPRQTNIRGIKCEIVRYDSTNQASIQKAARNESTDEASNVGNSNQISNGDDVYIKSGLIFICILMSAFFIIFLYLNRDRIFKSNSGSTVTHTQNGRTLSPAQIVEYSNEKVLIK